MSANMEDPAMAKGLEKVNLHPNSKKGSTKDYFHHQTIALICHASKVMLKIWHARLQHYENQKLSDAQLGFRKGTATRDQTANILWIIEKARGVPEKRTSTSVSWTTLKSLTVDHNNLWKALKEMGIPDGLTCLLRNLHAGQEATVSTLYRTTDLFKIEKGVQ